MMNIIDWPDPPMGHAKGTVKHRYLYLRFSTTRKHAVLIARIIELHLKSMPRICPRCSGRQWRHLERIKNISPLKIVQSLVLQDKTIQAFNALFIMDTDVSLQSNSKLLLLQIGSSFIAPDPLKSSSMTGLCTYFHIWMRVCHQFFYGMPKKVLYHWC